MKKLLIFVLCFCLVLPASLCFFTFESAALPNTVSTLKVYTIKNAYTGNFLAQSAQTLTPCFAAAVSNNVFSHQAFRFVDSGTSCFIMPMTTCSDSLLSNLALSYYNNGQYNRGYFEYVTTASVSTLWTVTKLNNGNYTIRSAYLGGSNNYLTVDHNTGEVVLTSYSLAYSQWEISEISASYYFGGSYTYFSTPSAVCARSSSSVESLLTNSELLGSQLWNGYTSAVNVTYLTSNQSVPQGSYDFILIEIDTNGYLGSTELAKIIPVTAFVPHYTDAEDYVDTNWQYVFILLNQSLIQSSGLTESALKTLIAHETGHCLKMKHTFLGNALFNLPADSFPSLMSKYTSNVNGDNYNDANGFKQCHHLTNLNTHMLLKKWN